MWLFLEVGCSSTQRRQPQASWGMHIPEFHLVAALLQAVWYGPCAQDRGIYLPAAHTAQAHISCEPPAFTDLQPKSRDCRWQLSTARRVDPSLFGSHGRSGMI